MLILFFIRISSDMPLGCGPRRWVSSSTAPGRLRPGSMPFPTKDETHKARMVLANLPKAEQKKRALEMARDDYRKEMRNNHAWYRIVRKSADIIRLNCRQTADLRWFTFFSGQWWRMVSRFCSTRNTVCSRNEPGKINWWVFDPSRHLPQSHWPEAAVTNGPELPRWKIHWSQNKDQCWTKLMMSRWDRWFAAHSSFWETEKFPVFV